MATFISMINEIADDYSGEALTTQSIKDAINRSIKHYERRRWWFTETASSSTFSTVASQELYGSSTLAAIPNMAEIFSMTGVLGTTRLPIIGTDWNTIEDSQTGAVTGFPANFAYFAEEIRLYPIPDAAYTISVAYTPRLTDLSADTDENAWTTEAYELIKQAAKYRLALNKSLAPDLAGMAKSQEVEAFDELLAENRRRIANKKLTTPDLVTRGAFDILTGL